MTVFRLLVYPGNTNLNDLNPPSERAMGYIGFHCTQGCTVSVSTNYFFLIHPPRQSAVSNFCLEPMQVSSLPGSKTLSISRGCQRNNNTLIRDGPFSSLGTAMYLLIESWFFFAKVVFPSKVQKYFFGIYSKIPTVASQDLEMLLFFVRSFYLPPR